MNTSLTKTAVVAIVVAPAPVPKDADAACNYSWDWVASTCERVTRIAHDGNWDPYLTGYGWHIDGYEDPSHLISNSWGGGAGKHWTDANGNEDVLFAMAFSDSHKHLEPIAGYARQWFTNPMLGGLSMGGVSSRASRRARTSHTTCWSRSCCRLGQCGIARRRSSAPARREQGRRRLFLGRCEF